jgi:hypothetical protein
MAGLHSRCHVAVQLIYLLWQAKLHNKRDERPLPKTFTLYPYMAIHQIHKPAPWIMNHPLYISTNCNIFEKSLSSQKQQNLLVFLSHSLDK